MASPKIDIFKRAGDSLTLLETLHDDPAKYVWSLAWHGAFLAVAYTPDGEDTVLRLFERLGDSMVLRDEIADNEADGRYVDWHGGGNILAFGQTDTATASVAVVRLFSRSGGTLSQIDSLELAEGE